MAIKYKLQTRGQFLVDRKYQTTARNERPNHQRKKDFRFPHRNNGTAYDTKVQKKGSCYICKKGDCKSWKYTKEEQRAERERWKRDQRNRGKSGQSYKTYVQNMENPSEDFEDSEMDLLEADLEEFFYEDSGATSHFITAQNAQFLADESFTHKLFATSDQPEEA